MAQLALYAQQVGLVKALRQVEMLKGGQPEEHLPSARCCEEYLRTLKHLMVAVPSLAAHLPELQ